MDKSDRELFDRWQAGDNRAGEELWSRHQAAIAGFFGKRAGTTATDLVQETWLQCLKSHPNYRGDASFRTFLFAVAHNVLRHHLRRPGHLEHDEIFAEIPMSQPSPPSLVQRRSEIAALSAAFRELPDEHRVLLEMSYEQQLDSGEIGALLQIPSATVRTRLRRARDLLREKIENGAGRDGAAPRSALEAFDLWASTAPPEPEEPTPRT